MSIENAIIERAYPQLVTQRSDELLRFEASKGCIAEISSIPVDIEPYYLPPPLWRNENDRRLSQLKLGNSDRVVNQVRLECWISKENEIDWQRAERFLKQITSVTSPIGFEIIGNRKNISLYFLIDTSEKDRIIIPFRGEFPNSELVVADSPNIFKEAPLFFDYFPTPFYHHQFTRPSEIHTSPFESFIIALSELREDQHGFVQILFKSTKNNWHQNVEVLTDLEFMSKSNSSHSSRYSQQVPSGDLHNMAHEVVTKAHNDKPFYFVAIRTGVYSDESPMDITGISSFVNLFQHGGQPLQHISNKDYSSVLSKEQIKEMLIHGLTYRPGFLLNSAELSGLIHLPTIKSFEERGIKINTIDSLSRESASQEQTRGIRIGSTKYLGRKNRIYLDNTLRETGIHIIGRPGTGKSTLIESMVMQDVKKGRGLAFIDPHGDSIKRILKLIPEEKVESTIYLDFGDPKWVPIWNPLKVSSGDNISREADDILASIKAIVKSGGWGDRLEHILRNGLIGLMHIVNPTFYDLLVLFEQTPKKSKQNEYLRNRILEAIDDKVLRRFWEKEFINYRRDDFAPSHHKLSKLLTADRTVSRMLTQPDNLINFKEIMDSGKTILLDLSSLGPETNGIIGTYLLSFLHSNLLHRSNTETEKRIPFSIYCDEAHKLTTDTLEDIIAESRKFGVSLILAHQYLSQFTLSQRDALMSMGSTMIFNVDLSDARYLVKDLRGKITPSEIAELKMGNAMARLGTKILKIDTPKPLDIKSETNQDEIIQNSRKLYCKSITELEKKNRYSDTFNRKATTNYKEGIPKDFKFDYDEFK